MKNRTLLIYACFYLAFLYLPVLVLPLFSFNNSAFIAFPELDIKTFSSKLIVFGRLCVFGLREFFIWKYL